MPPQSQGSSHRKTLCVVLPAMVLPLIASLFYFVIFSGSAFAQILYALTKLFTLVWPLFAMYAVLGMRAPRIEWSDPRHLASLRTGALLGLLLLFGIALTMETALGDAIRENSGAVSAKIREIGIENHYWSFGLFLALFHSLIEEYYWRWFVYGNLRTLYRPASAHLAAGISFAAHHLVVLSQFFPFPLAVLFTVGVAVGGIIWSLLYERQGSLMGAWLCHVVVDLGILTVGYRLLS